MRLSLLFLTVTTLAAQAQAPVTVTNVSVIDVRTGQVRPGTSVVIQDGRILRIGGAAAGTGRQVDGSGKFLIPGLWDMHVHLIFGDWFPDGAEITLPLFVANGVTAVRDMGSDLDPILQWRAAVAAGKMLGPRIVTPGPMLDGPKPRFPSSIAIATPDEGRKAVRDLKARGVDFIKLQSQIPREAVFAIADEAKKQGITFVGHVPDAVRAREMSEAGQKSFEHLIGVFEGSSPSEDEFLTGNKSPAKFLATYEVGRASALAALLAQNHTWQCPTLIWERGANLIEERDLAHDSLGRYVPAWWKNTTWKRFTDQVEHEFNVDDLATRRRFVDKELELVNLLHKAGVPFLAGTDTPPGVYVLPGFSLHDELGILVHAGFTPLEALQTATLNPSIFLGLERETGTVEAGKRADLVLLDANPLVDIANTRKIAGVFLRGRYFGRGELKGMLDGVARKAAS
jgi:imidazolonepropionase-like amidohydrolase